MMILISHEQISFTLKRYGLHLKMREENKNVLSGKAVMKGVPSPHPTLTISSYTPD